MKKFILFLGLIAVFAACTKKFNVLIETSGTKEIVYEGRSLKLGWYRINFVGNCNTYALYVDNDSSGFYTNYVDSVIAQVEICDGEDGEPPDFSFEQIPGDSCTLIVIYANAEPKDTICIEKALNGKDGKDGKNGLTSVPYKTFEENFDGGNSYHYDSLGWELLGTNMSINHNAPPKENDNGTLVSWDYNKVLDIVWTPYFDEATGINYVGLDIGSRGKWEIEMLFLHENGDTTSEKIEVINPVDNFVWHVDSTYTQKFIYEKTPWEVFNNQDVIRVGFRVSKVGDFEIPVVDWRNYVFNGDNLVIYRIRFYQQ